MEISHSEHPFPYSVIDDAFDPDLVSEAASCWPDDDWDWTVRYQSPLEKKRACNEWAKFPPAISILLSQILRYPVRRLFDALQTTVLTPDCSLWGGGMHATGRGGHLDLHEDSDHHVKWRWWRRVNAVLFLNPHWEEEWRGHLEFWDSGMTHCAARVAPKFNRLVVFTIDDGAFHGIPEPLQCPEEVQRMSLAAFWFSPPVGLLKRPRARFVARPGDPYDSDKEELRKRRAV